MAGMSGVRLFLVLIAIAAIAAKLGEVLNWGPMNLEWLAACAVVVLAIYGLAGLLWGKLKGTGVIDSKEAR